MWIVEDIKSPSPHADGGPSNQVRGSVLLAAGLQDRITTRYALAGQGDNIGGAIGIAGVFEIGRDNLGAAGEGGIGAGHVVDLGLVGLDVGPRADDIAFRDIFLDVIGAQEGDVALKRRMAFEIGLCGRLAGSGDHQDNDLAAHIVRRDQAVVAQHRQDFLVEIIEYRHERQTSDPVR